MSQVRIEKAGNRILLASDAPTPGLKVAISGAYFRKDKTWSLPLDLETCALLRERYGKRLVIGPLLWGWAKAERAQRSELQTLAAAGDAELKLLPELAPKLAEAMKSRTYQRSGVAFVTKTAGRDGRRRSLLADTVGLGKTAQALGALLESGEPGPYLIVCPKTAVNATWKAEIERWLPEDQVITVPEGRAARDNILNSLAGRANNWTNEQYEQGLASLARTWVVLHPAAIRTQTWWFCALCGSQTKFTTKPIEALDCGHPKDRHTRTADDAVFPQLGQIEWGGMVVDESHQILIKKTGTPNLQRRGAEILGENVRPGGVRLAMSGTPFRSKPHQIWSTLNWLDPVRWSGKWRWIARYWDTSGGTFGGMELGEFKDEREGLLLAELSDVMLRRERKDVRSDLPARDYAGRFLLPGDETSPKGIWLPMEGKQLRAYKQMSQTATATLDGGEVSAIGVLAELTRLKQFAGAEGAVDPYTGEFRPIAAGNKYEWLLAFMEELGLPDKPASKLVVVSQFTQILNAFGAGVKDYFRKGKHPSFTVGYITGQQSQKVRDTYIERFEEANSGLDVLFLNTVAGGASITLDAADVMVILDDTWVDDDREQVEGRIDNRNPERKIVPRTYYHVRSLESVEEIIALSNAEAKLKGKRILDGMTLQEFVAKQLPR